VACCEREFWPYGHCTCWSPRSLALLCHHHAVCLVLFQIFHGHDSPVSVYLPTGNVVLWARFAEWFLSCPVILIHLSNITGLKEGCA
jgi:hypothetical protein